MKRKHEKRVVPLPEFRMAHEGRFLPSHCLARLQKLAKGRAPTHIVHAERCTGEPADVARVLVAIEIDERGWWANPITGALFDPTTLVCAGSSRVWAEALHG